MYGHHMTPRVRSFLLEGIDAKPCEVEIDLDERSLARETIVGLPDAAVKESLERVRAAIANTGYATPAGRLLVNLAPANVRKEGPVYDLPIAVGLLLAAGIVAPPRPAPAPSIYAAGRPGDEAAEAASAPPPQQGLDHRRLLLAGELALDGRLRPVRGVIAMAHLARALGMEGVIVPRENAHEAAVIDAIEVHAAGSLAEVVALLNGSLEPSPQAPVDVASLIRRTEAEVDFADVKGQESVKRALTVAAAGGHNLLMIGPAGTGKTMMARALPGILPPMTPDQALEVSRVYSALGKLTTSDAGRRAETDDPSAHASGLVTARPVRAPHHTASAAAVIGGGVIPRPGEISLAHRGILFLDELPEFPRAVLDTLRQPLESGDVTISRAHGSVTFPARFMLIAAMNPTAKGDQPAGAEGHRAAQRYLSRVSRPLIDRIDIHVEAPAVPWKHLTRGAPTGPSTADLRDRVECARARQRGRQGERLNAELSGKQLNSFAPLEPDAEELLGQAITELGLSARAYDKIRRVARTIADIDSPGDAGAHAIPVAAVAEAVQYRTLDRDV